MHVFVDETRPRNQGASLTAFELGQQKVPHTLIVDNAGGHLMQRGEIDLVIVGADRIAANGDACNKIGTYLKALAARDCGVPFYVAAPVSTFDAALAEGGLIPIEERAPEEVTFMPGTRAQWRSDVGAHRAEGHAGAQPGLRRHPGAAGQRHHHGKRLVRGEQRGVGGAGLTPVLQRLEHKGAEGMTVEKAANTDHAPALARQPRTPRPDGGCLYATTLSCKREPTLQSRNSQSKK